MTYALEAANYNGQSGPELREFYMSFSALPICIVIASIVGCLLCGMVAIVSPARFARIAGFWGKWIETRPQVPLVDARVDVDSTILRYTRPFGVAVICAAAVWLALIAKTL